MKHDELWNDTLGTELPDGWQAPSLAAMKHEAARLRMRRRVARACAGIAALLVITWMMWPKTERDRSVVSAPPPPPFAPYVRYLTDAEFIDRLHDAGIGIGVAGFGDEKQLLLVSQDGTIYRP